MNIKWSSRQEELKKEYANFGRQEVAPRALALAADNKFDQQSWDLLAEQGLWNLIVPMKYSGQQPNWWDFTAALEGLASTISDGGFLLSLISQAGFIRGLSALGSPSQLDRCMPSVLRGAVSATCIAEPQSGTDTGSLQTTAHGALDALTLSGEKFNIAHAPNADFLVVLGRIPDLGKRDITLFLLHKEHEGVVRGLPEAKMGNRTLPTSWLRFEDVSLGSDDILGKPGDGIRGLGQVVGIDRIYYGWMGALLLTPLLEEASRFIQSRNSFKKPLADHQYVQQKITNALIGLSQARWVGIGALSELLEAKPSAGLEGSIAKLTGTNAMIEGARDLMALLGSRGYQDGLASHLLKDALGWVSVGGTEETHRINIFNQYMRLRRKR